MKRTFELLIFSGGDTSASSNPASKPAACPATASGARQGALWQEREAALRALASGSGLKVHDQLALTGPTEDCLACCTEWPIDKIANHAVMLLAGSPTAEQLLSAAETLKRRGNDVLIVVDALAGLADLLPSLVKLNEEAVEMVAAGAVEKLIAADRLMVYRFPKADSTTTIAVFADIASDDPLVLTMVRDGYPFKDMESFPGGFLNVQLESLSECAARELMEECFVSDDKAKGEKHRFTYQVPADQMVLIDVRSDPGRDERGHVVDHGYAWYIPSDRQDAVMKALNAGDDAKSGSARFVRASELMGRALAFDHKDLFLKALSRLKKQTN